MPKVGDMLAIAPQNASAVDMSSGSTLYCGFASGLGAGFSQWSNGTCMIPTSNVTDGQTCEPPSLRLQFSAPRLTVLHSSLSSLCAHFRRLPHYRTLRLGRLGRRWTRYHHPRRQQLHHLGQDGIQHQLQRLGFGRLLLRRLYALGLVYPCFGRDHGSGFRCSCRSRWRRCSPSLGPFSLTSSHRITLIPCIHEFQRKGSCPKHRSSQLESERSLRRGLRLLAKPEARRPGLGALQPELRSGTEQLSEN
jgi:hypothetical protein